MAKNTRIVQPHSGGGWQVRAPGAERASARAATQLELVGRAREILVNQGGGELLIAGRNGRFREANTIPPAKDPRKTRG